MKGESKQALELVASGLEEIARQAREAPQVAVSYFYDLPPREDLTEGGMRALDSAAGRKAFEEELKAQGGGG